MNRYQARRVLGVDAGSTPEQVKSAYRRIALEAHPDRNGDAGDRFKEATEAYNLLKDAPPGGERARREGPVLRKRTEWGAPGRATPEEDWSRYTKEFEESDPGFWKEYERKFWEDYNSRTSGGAGPGDGPGRGDGPGGILVGVDKSLCIGCCSCETIAPEVFRIDRSAVMNPKSAVIDMRGAGPARIMSAAETCPTKAIIINDAETGRQTYPR